MGEATNVTCPQCGCGDDDIDWYCNHCGELADAPGNRCNRSSMCEGAGAIQHCWNCNADVAP